MNRRLILDIIIFVIAVSLILFVWDYMQNKDNDFVEDVPSAPTQQEIDDAKKLSKDECSCWDGTRNICLPIQDCI